MKGRYFIMKVIKLAEPWKISCVDIEKPVPKPGEALIKVVAAGICDIAAGWRLVSEGPARLLGLEDRGRIAPGLRADLAILDRATGRVGGTIAGGRITHLASPLAERFFA